MNTMCIPYGTTLIQKSERYTHKYNGHSEEYNFYLFLCIDLFSRALDGTEQPLPNKCFQLLYINKKALTEWLMEPFVKLTLGRAFLFLLLFLRLHAEYHQ